MQKFPISGFVEQHISVACCRMISILAVMESLRKTAREAEHDTQEYCVEISASLIDMNNYSHGSGSRLRNDLTK